MDVEVVCRHRRRRLCDRLDLDHRLHDHHHYFGVQMVCLREVVAAEEADSVVDLIRTWVVAWSPYLQAA